MRCPSFIALLLALAACRPESPATRQLVVLAVDGLDPDILSRLIDDRRLPHLAALAAKSGVVRVVSTPGAESASAWASFATGVNPGRHGVFDAIAPDPTTARPRAATLRERASAQWFRGMWKEGPAYAPVRDGPAFWGELGRTGIRARVLFVPGTFPPEPIESGEMVSGVPLPDLGGGWGSGYTWLASDIAPEGVGFTRYGGRVERLVFERPASSDAPKAPGPQALVARASLIGLRAPVRVDLPMTVYWNPEQRTANISIANETVHLQEGQQSRWLTLTIRLGVATTVAGLARVQLVKAGNDVQVYVSPIQWHPDRPPSAISSPPDAAATLFARLGTFRTLSWPDSAWAVADGHLPAEAYVAAAGETFDDRAAAVLSQADSSGWDLLVAGVETLEAASRLLWRSADDAATVIAPGDGAGATITDLYRRLDDLVGELRQRLPATADVVVVSAYGVRSVRTVVDVNRWLVEQGLLAWREAPLVTLPALIDPSLGIDGLDWSRTAARFMGAGHLYLKGGNLANLSPSGEGPDPALVAAVQVGLESLTDPLSGRRVISRVRRGRELYKGEHLPDAPDLVVSFAPGFGPTWESTLGAAADAIVSANAERWRAGHAGFDEAEVPGVWLSTLPLGADRISVLDVGPTVLQYFGRSAATGEGRAQLRESPSSDSRR